MKLKLTLACSILLAFFASTCIASQNDQAQGIPGSKLLSSKSVAPETSYQAVNTQGIVQANSIVHQDGVIRLVSLRRGVTASSVRSD